MTYIIPIVTIASLFFGAVFGLDGRQLTDCTWQKCRTVNGELRCEKKRMTLDGKEARSMHQELMQWTKDDPVNNLSTYDCVAVGGARR